MDMNERLRRALQAASDARATEQTEQQARDDLARAQQAEIDEIIRKFLIWVERAGIGPRDSIGQFEKFETRGWRRTYKDKVEILGWKIQHPWDGTYDTENRRGPVPWPRRDWVFISEDGELTELSLLMGPEGLKDAIAQYAVDHNISIPWPG